MSPLRKGLIGSFLGLLFVSLCVAHLSASATIAERERENKIVVDVLVAKTVKVGGITISGGEDYSGIWLTHPKVKGTVNLYLTKDQGPCIGLHRNKELSTPDHKNEAYDLALSARDGEPVVQFRKKDGTLGFIGITELEKVVEKKKQ